MTRWVVLGVGICLVVIGAWVISEVEGARLARMQKALAVEEAHSTAVRAARLNTLPCPPPAADRTTAVQDAIRQHLAQRYAGARIANSLDSGNDLLCALYWWVEEQP